MSISGDTVVNISVQVLAILIPAAVGWFIALVNKKLGTEKTNQIAQQLKVKRGLAWDAVNFVQQAFGDLGGPEKFAKAESWLATQAQSHGISLTADQIQGLIESAVKMMKDSAYGSVPVGEILETSTPLLSFPDVTSPITESAQVAAQAAIQAVNTAAETAAQNASKVISDAALALKG